MRKPKKSSHPETLIKRAKRWEQHSLTHVLAEISTIRVHAMLAILGKIPDIADLAHDRRNQVIIVAAGRQRLTSSGAQSTMSEDLSRLVAVRAVADDRRVAVRTRHNAAPLV